MVPTLLIIAGSDSGGGAGIQADVKTASVLGVHPVTAIAAITVQNTRGVRRVVPTPPSLLEEQILCCLEDFDVRAVKVGVLYSRDNVRKVIELLRSVDVPVVVDPVIKAGTGEKLIEDGAIEDLKELVRLATIATPNVMEAETLLGREMKSLEDIRDSVKEFPTKVVLKGGHLPGERVVDFFWDGKELREFVKERVEDLHGTGCVFSTAIAAYLAKGYDVSDAVELAEAFMEEAIRWGIEVGKGRKVIDPVAPTRRKAESFGVLERVEAALREVEERVPPQLVPEVGMQVVECLEGAKSAEEVAGISGRITVRRPEGAVRACGRVRFGASSHMARALLALHSKDPRVKGGINAALREELVERAREKGLTVFEFSREEEPEEVRRVEGRTMQWAMQRAFEACGKAPDIVVDKGGYGKEPMIVVFGKDSLDAVRKLLRLAGIESG